MHRLSAVDSLFTSLDTPGNEFHVGAVTIFDPSTAPEGADGAYDGLRNVIQSRIHLLKPFRWRLLEVPGGLGHPWWMEDPDFDVDNHLHRVRLSWPGGPAQLADFAADVMRRPLDRSKPLWEIHVVEGLEGGLTAGVAKIHHALTDGVSGAMLTATLMDLSPVTVDAGEPVVEWKPDVVTPPTALLAAHALWEQRKLWAHGARTAVRMTRSAAGMFARNRRPGAEAPPAVMSAPRTSLNSRLGPRRVVGMSDVPMEDVKRVRRATGTTVNDVILTMTSSVLRGYLDYIGDLPDQPLVAFVPVSVRDEADTLEEGANKLSGMLVSLATTTEDPIERLMAISESARNAKEQDRILGSTMLEDVAEMMLPCALIPAARVASAAGISSQRPPFNVTVSAFPGSPFPLYCAGARMVAYHPFGPVVDGVALNVTAMSYGDHIGFGLHACPDAVPDIDSLARGFPEALTELVKQLD